MSAAGAMIERRRRLLFLLLTTLIVGEQLRSAVAGWDAYSLSLGGATPLALFGAIVGMLVLPWVQGHRRPTRLTDMVMAGALGAGLPVSLPLEATITLVGAEPAPTAGTLVAHALFLFGSGFVQGLLCASLLASIAYGVRRLGGRLGMSPSGHRG